MTLSANWRSSLPGTFIPHLEGTAIERATPNRKDLGREHGRFPENCNASLPKWHAVGVQVVLIPDQDRARYDLYKVAPSDSARHFTIRGITPGAYKVFAGEALEE